MQTTRIRSFYQADPLGVVAGGIDTFIRGLVKWAPEDLEFSVVGMTTEPDKRPVGRWTRCSLGRRDFDFFPVFVEHNAGGRSAIPSTLRLCRNVVRYRVDLMRGFDVLELHRVEPLLLFFGDTRPKNAFFHQDMMHLQSKNTESRWRVLPSAYFWLENRLIPMLETAFCVRETGVSTLRKRFPSWAGSVHFVPTWVDVEIFHPELDAALADELRAQMRAELGLLPSSKLVVTVGRIDITKQPDLLFDAFARIAAAHPELVLVYVGDGALRHGLQGRVASTGFAPRVRFLGLRPQKEIARLLRSADVFALSSAYEGMPMALLEALGSGLPVVTMDVGEVRKVVNESCGTVVHEQTAEAFAAGLDRVLRRAPGQAGVGCVQAIDKFTPAKVLARVYENYRELGAQQRSGTRSHR
ncbi:MAG: glycosyltransferase family 4 protein [Burkholderiaceae bacterium]|nr:glycosyltransferase family 4 protein [Burkholderiaceae bacterium]